MANYGQAMEMARQLEASGGLPQGVTLAMMAQQLMGSNAEQPPLPERGGMPAMTTGLLESVRAGAAAPVQGDPIAAETAARQARAAQAGGVSPEMEAIYAAREARLAKQDEAAPKDDRRAAWDALAQMGFKMAQTTSPYFATALAEGMQAGSQGYNAAKVAAAEKAARREEEKENVSLARLKDRQAAVAAAEAGYAADVGTAKDKAALSKSAADVKVAEAQARVADVKETLGIEAARAELNNLEERKLLTRAQRKQVEVETGLAPGLAAARMAGDRLGGGAGSTRGVSPTAIFEAEQSALKQMEELATPVNEALDEYKKAKAAGLKDDAAAALAKYKMANTVYQAARSRFQSIPGGRFQTSQGGAPAPRTSAPPPKGATSGWGKATREGA